MRAETHRKTLLWILGALTLLAWLTLWVWEGAPYGQHIHHRLAKLSLEDGLGGIVVPGALFVASWTLMTVAMMLPTTLPLVEMFERITSRRGDRAWLMALLFGGYLGVWTAFGIVAQAGNWGLEQVIQRTAWLGDNRWALGAGTLILAGVYQFTPLKYRCLDQCRSPLSFIMQHWQGKREQRQAFLLGAHSGLSCVGCCWTLMAVLFVAGVMNLLWVAAIAAFVLMEKIVPGGERIGRISGIAVSHRGSLPWGRSSD